LLANVIRSSFVQSDGLFLARELAKLALFFSMTSPWSMTVGRIPLSFKALIAPIAESPLPITATDGSVFEIVFIFRGFFKT
jgi:hypothetical protein